MDFLRRMMAGRYGSDALNNAFLVLAFLLMIVEWISGWHWMSAFILALLFLCYFRIFSRNISARYAENQRFLHWWNPIAQRLWGAGNRMKDRKTHRYYKCPQCKQRLRVPRGKGKIDICCPKCGTHFVRKT